MAAKDDATTGYDLGEVVVEDNVRPVDEVRRQRKEHLLEHAVEVLFSSQIVAAQLRRPIALLPDDLHESQVRPEPALGCLPVHVLAVLDLVDQLLQLELVERVRIVQRFVDDLLQGELVVQKIFLVEFVEFSRIRSLIEKTRPVESFRFVQLAETVDAC